jgi:hypothetical protein
MRNFGQGVENICVRILSIDKRNLYRFSMAELIEIVGCSEFLAVLYVARLLSKRTSPATSRAFAEGGANAYQRRWHPFIR